VNCSCVSLGKGTQKERHKHKDKKKKKKKEKEKEKEKAGDLNGEAHGKFALDLVSLSFLLLPPSLPPSLLSSKKYCSRSPPESGMSC
jgi:hypothetical protein